MEKRIGIIGGGFSGTMLVRHLVEQQKDFFSISIYNSNADFARGVAYNPNSSKLLLNVVAGKMSAFPDKPNHFVEWCLNNGIGTENAQDLLAGSFLPRSIYGNYLNDIWKETQEIAKKKGHKLNLIPNKVSKIDKDGSNYQIHSESSNETVDYLILATGNELPGNPQIRNVDFFNSNFYQQNPWRIDFSKINKLEPILIFGNGLTMVDTVMELRENGFQQRIVSVSPNGFNILPHRNFNFQYTGRIKELNADKSLLELLSLFISELKKLNQFGISAEPLIDAFRPNTQRIWQTLTTEEKRIFMRRLRHLWGVARHRIPFSSYDYIQRERIANRLEILAGKVVDLKINENVVLATIYDKKNRTELHSQFAQVINCTGPETKIEKSGNELLKQLKLDGLIIQDELQLGIEVNDSFQVINSQNQVEGNMFAIGGLLKGKLWESTAINELRVQAKTISNSIISYR
ncbi:MAG: FAD/NAD(P)-binding protein [Bacteroidetes bacterium]|nr:FAD/NAD(P)-binding protein [Bacteroidota bacterium]